MKKILILAVLFTSCYNVERNCIDFKTGEFEFSSIIDDSLVTSQFTRTDKFEIELFNSSLISSINSDVEVIKNPGKKAWTNALNVPIPKSFANDNENKQCSK